MIDWNGALWRKSSRCNSADVGCVEVARHGELVAVRDSKDPDGPVLVFSTREWDLFTDGMRSGDVY